MERLFKCEPVNSLKNESLNENDYLFLISFSIELEVEVFMYIKGVSVLQ